MEEPPRRLLLIRLGSLGDLILTTPAARAARRAFPEAHVAVLTSEPLSAIYAGNPHVDEVLTVDRRRLNGSPAEVLRAVRRIRDGGFDVSVDLQRKPKTALLAWAGRIRRRIGATWLDTERVSAAPDEHASAEALRALAPLRVRTDDMRTEVSVSERDDAEALSLLQEKGVPIHGDYETMLQEVEGVDVIALPTPIHSHAPMTIQALDRGFHVLVEKPPAATVQEVDAMIDARDRAGKLCAVGFQLITGTGIQKLKKMVCSGEFGDIVEVVACGKWKRQKSYYERQPWAGQLKCDGRYVLDGPLNNPLAHILNNELYVASAEDGKLARPLEVTAELYRGHDFIKSENTSCLRASLDNGAKVYFFVTLCAADNRFS